MSDALPRDIATLLAFDDGDRYDPTVPTPRAILGHDLGERIARHHEIRGFFGVLAESERGELVTYGRSVEGRELFQLVISDPGNLARLDSIRESMAVLADPGEPLPDLDDLPVVVWIIANVHGGEHSSAEGAMALAWHLTASTDESVAELLRQAVIVIDPLQNPDGRDRSVNGYYAYHGVQPNPDPRSVEHECPWPGSRGSHYAFDLNRDWCLLTHPESRARVASFLEWRPQVVADLHEMGSSHSYYFAPPARPIEANVPASTHAWWDVFGRANAGAFDARGWDYFVAETFDSFYPGYGEAWPLYHGAVGMTYEQASPRSTAIRRDDEHVLTLREALAHHFVAAMTTCETAAANRREMLESYRRFHLEAIEEGQAGPHRAILIDAAGRVLDASEVAANLRAQGVDVTIAGAGFRAEAAPLNGGDAVERSFAPGSLIVSLAQPAGRLVRALFDPSPPLPPDFLQEERERVLGRAQPNIYDITSWSLPDRHGLEAFHAADPPRVDPPAVATPRGEAGMAYLLPGGTRATYRAVARMLSEDGWKIRVASRAFTLGERPCERGTVVVRVRDHEADLPERLRILSEQAGAEIVAVDTAWTEAGVRLGSIHVAAVERPKIALLTRPPVHAQPAGWAAYLLEQEYGLSYTPIDASRVSDRLLSHYNVLICPDAGGFKFADGVLRHWIAGGGVFVSLSGNVSNWLANCPDKLTSVRPLTDLRKARCEPEKPGEEQPPVPSEHRPKRMVGITARVDLDPYSYLTYGCPKQILVPLNTKGLFRPSIDGYNIGTFPTDAVAAGFAIESMREALPGHVYLWQERIGAGQVVAFADTPTFRASWPMLDRLWLNAVLYGQSRTRE